MRNLHHQSPISLDAKPLRYRWEETYDCIRDFRSSGHDLYMDDLRYECYVRGLPSINQSKAAMIRSLKDDDLIHDAQDKEYEKFTYSELKRLIWLRGIREWLDEKLKTISDLDKYDRIALILRLESADRLDKARKEIHKAVWQSSQNAVSARESTSSPKEQQATREDLLKQSVDELLKESKSKYGFDSELATSYTKEELVQWRLDYQEGYAMSKNDRKAWILTRGLQLLHGQGLNSALIATEKYKDRICRGSAYKDLDVGALRAKLTAVSWFHNESMTRIDLLKELAFLEQSAGTANVAPEWEGPKLKKKEQLKVRVICIFESMWLIVLK